VPAGGELAISFSFVALRPTTYTIGACVRFADGSQVDAALDSILITPPA
jgi:hypothetical protein